MDFSSIIGGIIASIAGIVFNKFWGNRIRIKRIYSSDDKYADELVDLYQRNFSDEFGCHYSVSELIEFINARFDEPRHVNVENIVLIATANDNLLGFISGHYHIDRRKAIISYFAIDKKIQLARKEAARSLILGFKKIITKKFDCEVLFFDIEGNDPARPSLSHEREARRVLFINKAKKLGLDLRQFDFPYVSPSVAVRGESHDYPFTLFAIGIKADIPHMVPKSLMMEYLRFIYMDCYGDVYSIDDPRFREYHNYLQSIVKNYADTLPEHIKTLTAK